MSPTHHAPFHVAAVEPLTGADDAHQRSLVAGASEVMRACAPELWGHDDFVRTPAFWWHRLTHAVSYERRLFVALNGDEVVGFAFVSLPLADNLHLMDDVEVMVRPDARRRGVGTALLDAVVALAAARGRTTLIGFGPAEAASEDDETALRSRTDPIAASRNSGAEFALARGFEVAQVERYSMVTVPADPTPASETPGYRIESWCGLTSARFAAGIAALWQEFSTDAPVGDIEFAEEAWDADRYTAIEVAAADIVERCTSVAIDEASGVVVGMTQLIKTIGREASAEQGVTQVSGRHRGHGLGLALKRANLAVAIKAWPQLQRVHTWNAGENDHMWRINEAFGFVPRGAEVCWQRRL